MHKSVACTVITTYSYSCHCAGCASLHKIVITTVDALILKCVRRHHGNICSFSGCRVDTIYWLFQYYVCCAHACVGQYEISSVHKAVSYNHTLILHLHDALLAMAAAAADILVLQADTDVA